MNEHEPSSQQVAQILENFLQGTADTWAWDDFTLGMSFEDKNLEAIRSRCAGLSNEFPPDNPNEYCNEAGRSVIRQYIQELRKKS